MWIFSKQGFFSLTRSPIEASKFQLRSRESGDLQSLRQNVLSQPCIKSDLARLEFWSNLDLMITEHTDYRFRFILDQRALGEVFDALESGIDYTNFKDAVKHTPTQRHKVGALHEIWATMLRFQLDAQDGDEESDSMEDDFASHAHRSALSFASQEDDIDEIDETQVPQGTSASQKSSAAPKAQRTTPRRKKSDKSRL